MRSGLFLISMAVLSVGCQSVSTVGQQQIEFLTRQGCVNTPAALANLESVLASTGGKYALVQQDDLPGTDPRTGYPTPTILVNGRDLFGLPTPLPPFPTPT